MEEDKKRQTGKTGKKKKKQSKKNQAENQPNLDPTMVSKLYTTQVLGNDLTLYLYLTTECASTNTDTSGETAGRRGRDLEGHTTSGSSHPRDWVHASQQTTQTSTVSPEQALSPRPSPRRSEHSRLPEHDQLPGH